MAYYRVEPFGVDQVCRLLAHIAAILVNTHKRKGTKSIRPEDFYQTMSIGPRQSVEDMKMVLMALATETKRKKEEA